MFAVAITREAELPTSASGGLSQIAKGGVELRQARDTILSQSKELAGIAQLKMCIKSPEDNVAFYKASEGSVKSELTMLTAESSRLGQFIGSVRAEVHEIKEKLAASDTVG